MRPSSCPFTYMGSGWMSVVWYNYRKFSIFRVLCFWRDRSKDKGPPVFSPSMALSSFAIFNEGPFLCFIRWKHVYPPLFFISFISRGISFHAKPPILFLLLWKLYMPWRSFVWALENALGARFRSNVEGDPYHCHGGDTISTSGKIVGQSSGLWKRG